MWRYFSRRGDPATRITLSNGKFITVQQVDHDFGVIATAKENVIADIQSAIRRQSGGWEEIAKEQYESFLAQKKTDLKPRWREEHSNAEMRRPSIENQNPPPPAAPSVVAVNPRPLPPTGPSAASFRPTASPRSTE
jgi:hypothetical protein